ncbi:MAG: hypothetical protein WBL93_09325 [Lutisporaceae bacterium]
MEDKAFDLIEKMYVEFSKKFDSMDKRFVSMDKRFDSLESEIKELKSDVSSIKKTVLYIEQDHGQKLEALFDGYKQNTDKLDRIEAEVARHEEVIIRRVK